MNDFSINRRFRSRESATLEERLLSNRGFSESGCWVWLGAGDKYGIITYNGVHYNVSRISAFLYLGLKLEDRTQFACHKDDICKRKDCFNPDHLYVGSRDTNSQDRSKLTTHCPYGHEYSPSNTRIYNGNRYCRLCSKLRHREERAGLPIGSLR